MERILRFYKETNKWYVDLPDWIESGGTKEDCEMVIGADEWLDQLSKGSENITLRVSDDVILDSKLTLLAPEDLPQELVDLDLGGGFYQTDTGHTMWLCDVTIFVFYKMPNEIYYEIIQ